MQQLFGHVSTAKQLTSVLSHNHNLLKMSKKPKTAKTSATSDVSHNRPRKDDESLNGCENGVTPVKRVRLDIELRCKDGSVEASAHNLSANSVVFDRMLFSAMPMAESRTNIVHLDDILMAEMELMIKFCQTNECYSDLVKDLMRDSVFSAIAVAHRFEFTLALKFLCARYVEVVPVPTPQQLQIADRMELKSVIDFWSLCCKSSSFYHKFVKSLLECPISAATLLLFTDVHAAAIDMMMPLEVDENIRLKDVTVFQHTIKLIKTNSDRKFGHATFLNHLPNEIGSFTMSVVATEKAFFGFQNIDQADLASHSCASGGTIVTDEGIRVGDMGRPIGNDILTLIYNPAAATMHGAYNREPEILLIKNIVEHDPPMQPFVCLCDINASATMVPNPRHGL